MRTHGKGKGPIALQSAENMRNRKGRMPALGMTIVSGETNKKALVFQGLSWRQKFCTLLSIYHTRICVVKRKNTSAYVFIFADGSFFS
jgi:hypothetical protein